MLYIVKCIYCYAKRTINYQRKSKNLDINTSSLPCIVLFYKHSIFRKLFLISCPGPNKYLGLFKCPVKTRHLIERKEKKDFCDPFRVEFWKNYDDFYEKSTCLILVMIFIFVFFNKRPQLTANTIEAPNQKLFISSNSPGHL